MGTAFKYRDIYTKRPKEVLKNMADMPDLSHLTPEERAIIENVMQRQKQEEDRENEIMR